MSTDPGGKPEGGRPGADTPQRLVVRAHGGDSSVIAATDTAVASATSPLGGATDARRPSEPDLVGATLAGRYLVTRKVGQGGMGAVYEATHTLIGKRVAVKVLLEKYARREVIVQRLEQEARLASSCQNEHIIDITDFGATDDGRTFVVMEFLEGESLAECLARDQPLPEQRLLRIIAQAASALVAAHARGIVHRDIKPENLFLLRRNNLDFVKVVDFGISKSLRASDEVEDQPRLTQTGMVLGTPLYMSPEQARGDDQLDARVDVYALGVIMYEAVTGRVPFTGNNYLSVISQVLNQEPTPPRALRPELSEELESIILRAMAKDRRDRYASASELLVDLNALLDDPARSTERPTITGPRKRRLGSKSPLKIAIWVALIAVVIAAVVTTVVMLFGSSAVKQARARRVDAGAPPPPVAAVPAETIEVTIDTEPAGALVQVDGIDRGPSPVTVNLVVVHDHFTEVVASAEGYDDRKISFNTFVSKDKRYTIKLKKTASVDEPGAVEDVPRAGASTPVVPPPPPRSKTRPTTPAPARPTGKPGELEGAPLKAGSGAPTKS